MKVYMDVCCLNRPFDNQSQDKVRFETEAIITNGYGDYTTEREELLQGITLDEVVRELEAMQ